MHEMDSDGNWPARLNILNVPQWKGYIFDRDAIFSIMPGPEPENFRQKVMQTVIGEEVLAFMYPGRTRALGTNYTNLDDAIWAEAQSAEVGQLSCRLHPKFPSLQTVLNSGFSLTMSYTESPQIGTVISGRAGNTAGVRIPFAAWEEGRLFVNSLVGWVHYMPDSRYYGGVGFTRQPWNGPVCPCLPDMVQYVRAACFDEAFDFVKQKLTQHLDTLYEDYCVWGVSFAPNTGKDYDEYMQDKIEFIYPTLL